MAMIQIRLIIGNTPFTYSLDAFCCQSVEDIFSCADESNSTLIDMTISVKDLVQFDNKDTTENNDYDMFEGMYSS